MVRAFATLDSSAGHVQWRAVLLFNFLTADAAHVKETTAKRFMPPPPIFDSIMRVMYAPEQCLSLFEVPYARVAFTFQAWGSTAKQ